MKPKNKKLIAGFRKVEAALTQERDKLLVSLDLAKHENELLGQLNEHLRVWLQANMALAVQVGRACGVPEPKVEDEAPPPPSNRLDAWGRAIGAKNGNG
jgi:hypothetical protein